MFGRGFPYFGFTKQYTRYERSLEKLEKSLIYWSEVVHVLERRRDRVKKWSWRAVCLFFLVGLFYAGMLKRPSRAALTAVQHLRAILYVMLPVPVALVVHLVVPECIDLVITYGNNRKGVLEEHRRTIIRELKDSTRFDIISQIIEKYDPEAKAAKQAQSARARRDAAAPVRRHSDITRQGRAKATVFNMLQSTGQALSPLCDRLATILADDPSTQAAFGTMTEQLQQSNLEKAELQRQNYELKLRLSKYEDLGEVQQDATPAALLGAAHQPEDRNASNMSQTHHEVVHESDANIVLEGVEDNPRIQQSIDDVDAATMNKPRQRRPQKDQTAE